MAVATKTSSGQSQSQGPRGLRREVPFLGALALSIGIMAPTGALSLNGAGVAANVGKAVPLVFLLAAAGVGLVSYAFIRMSRYVSHAGSMFAFTGVALGPRAALAVGWTLLGTYLMLAATGAAGVGVFALNLFQDLGFLEGVDWLPVALIAFALVAAFGYGQMRKATRALLVLECVSVTLIVVLFAVIFIKLISGSAPHGDGFSLEPFSPSGVSTSAFFLGIVFAFLSFAGFEGAAALGEETDDPKRNIGRAIGGTLILGSVIYVIGMLAETLGFGTSAQGTEAFASSSAPLGDLAHSYVGLWYRDIVNFGAMMSLFAGTLGCTAFAARMLFTLGRDGVGPEALGKASPKTGSPLMATLVCVAFPMLVLIYMRIQGAAAVDAFFYTATMGTLGLLAAYILTNVSGFRFLILDGRAPRWEAFFPIAGTIFLGYVLWKQVFPRPPYPYNLFIWIDLVWVVVGCAYLFSRAKVVEAVRGDIEVLQSEAGQVVAAGPYIHAGEVDVVGPLTQRERDDADIL